METKWLAEDFTVYAGLCQWRLEAIYARIEWVVRFRKTHTIKNIAKLDLMLKKFSRVFCKNRKRGS